MVDDNKPMKYMRYAIGEILLVVIGILIALQINTWNENRKADELAKENYLNLLTSLEKDLVKVKQVIALGKKSLVALRKIIPAEINEDLLGLDEENLNNYLVEVSYAVRSFIPKTGVYNVLTSNNGFDLIKSERIKSLLINLYDYQYKNYEDLDGQIDYKYHNQLGSVLREKIVLIGEFKQEFTLTHRGSKELFKKHYTELANESRDIYPMLSYNTNTLIKIEESINELMPLIRDEIK